MDMSMQVFHSYKIVMADIRNIQSNVNSNVK